MLDTATVTMPYKELQELINKANEAEGYRKEVLAKALDSIVDILMKASDSKTAKEKQAYIRKCLEIYCKTFDISIKELLR